MPNTREQAPGLAIWGTLAPNIADLIKTSPPLAARLQCAPRRAMHAYAAYLHCAPDVPDGSRALADRLLNTHPRTLLNAALPGCHTRLYRLLDRVGDRVRDATFYLRLDAWLRSELATVVLNAPALDDKVVRFCETVAVMDPLTSRLARAFAPSVGKAKTLEELIFLLHIHGVLADANLTDIPANPTRKQAVRFLTRHIEMLRAPDPGIRFPPSLRMIHTVGELHALGRKFGNCLRPRRWSDPYWADMIAGKQIIVTSDDPPVVASLRPFGKGIWKIDQMAGPGNEYVPDDVRQQIAGEITFESGVVLIEHDLQDFLINMTDGPPETNDEGDAAQNDGEDQGATA